MLAGTLFFATSCKEDDPVEPSSEELILGSWNQTGATIDDGVLTINTNGSVSTSTFTSEGKDFDAKAVFTKAPNALVSTGSYTSVTTTTTNGQTNTKEVLEDRSATGTWSIEGDKLFITSNEKTSEYEIIKLTDSELQIGVDLITNDTTEAGTFTIITATTGKLISTFTK